MKDEKVEKGKKQKDNQNIAATYEKTIKLLDRYVERTKDGTFKANIDEKTAKKLGIEADVFNTIMTSMNYVNEEIRKGNFVSDENKKVYLRGETTVQQSSTISATATVSGGVTKWGVGEWWGGTFYLNSTDTGRVAGYMSLNGATAEGLNYVIKQLLGRSLPFGVASFILGLGAGWLTSQNEGNGVKVTYMLGVPPVVWVSPQ
jgi:hypothetical protein